MTGYQTKTITIGALIALAIAVLGWFVGAQPQLDNRSKYKQEAAMATQAAGQIRANIGQLKQKEAALPEANRQYQELSRQFPHAFEASQWADMIYSAARGAGVELEELAPSIPQVDGASGAATSPMGGGTPAAGTAPAAASASAAPGTHGAAASATQGNMASSTVQITATGSAGNLRDFVERLSKLQRPILVNSLTISESGDEAQLSISGSTYLMRELLDPASREAWEASRAGGAQAEPTPAEEKVDAPSMPEVR